MKSELVLAGLLTVIMLLALAPLTTSYVYAQYAGGGSIPDFIALDAPVLLNPQPLPPGLAPNISLTLTLTGNVASLTGALMVKNNTSSSPTSPFTIIQRACEVNVAGQVTVTSSVAAPGPSNVAIVVTGVFEPPNPCLAAQGFSISMQWNIFPSSVTLTTMSVTGASYQWTGYGTGLLRLNPQPLPPG